MEPREWTLGGLVVRLRQGPFDDSVLDLSVKTENIPLGTSPSGALSVGGTIGGLGISVKEASSAKELTYWPAVSIEDPDRRQVIFDATRRALELATSKGATSVGLFTMGLEVSLVPDWEIAEEIARALYLHAQTDTSVREVEIVTSSTAQLDSFIFALNNVEMLARQE
ncbi:MAG: hypothetical protein ACTSPE_10695 [Candidatus Thorarchaeota archaeon]